MKISYKVHSAVRRDLVTLEQIEGHDSERRIRDGLLVVELVRDLSPTLTVHVTGTADELAAAAAMLREDASIDVTLTLAE